MHEIIYKEIFFNKSVKICNRSAKICNHQEANKFEKRNQKTEIFLKKQKKWA